MKIVIPWADFVTMAKTELSRTQPMATGKITLIKQSTGHEPEREVYDMPDEVHVELDTPYNN